MTFTLDSPKLRELTRVQLQSLAKREVVRAVGKTEDIIRRLIQKHPKGVPVPQDGDNPSASSAPPKQNLLKQSSKDTPPRSPAPETTQHYTDPKGKGKAVAETPSPSSSTEALELLYPEDEPVPGPYNTYPESISASHPQVAEPVPFSVEPTLPSVLPSEPPSRGPPAEGQNARTHGAAPLPDTQAPNPGWRTDEDEAEQGQEFIDDNDAYDYVKGAPTHYMVVDALRQFTTLTNTIPAMERRVAEGRCLLRRAETLLDKATPDARELTVTREYLETFLLAKLKQKPELWDGTGRMDKKARKVRMAWLRAERKAENEKKWKEMNALYRKYGVKEEPFAAFESESDEEVIESLQTTPESSRSGGSKRAREESVGVESDADPTVGQSEKKRARS